MSFECKSLITALFVAAFLIAIAYSDEKIKLYDNKYDDIDVDAVLKNDRQRNQYYNCLLTVKPCITPDAKFLKEKFPEAIVTKCKYCTAKQKIIFEKIVLWYTENKPDEWNMLLKKTIENYQGSLS